MYRHVDNYPPYSPPTGGGSGGKKRKKNEPKETADWQPDRFEAFWKAYPRRVSRQDAIRAWDKLRPDDALIRTIAQALKRQLATEQWQQGIGIPYPATWLNNRRWEDEIGTAVPKKKPQPRREVMPEW